MIDDKTFLLLTNSKIYKRYLQDLERRLKSQKFVENEIKSLFDAEVFAHANERFFAEFVNKMSFDEFANYVTSELTGDEEVERRFQAISIFKSAKRDALRAALYSKNHYLNNANEWKKLELVYQSEYFNPFAHLVAPQQPIDLILDISMFLNALNLKDDEKMLVRCLLVEMETWEIALIFGISNEAAAHRKRRLQARLAQTFKVFYDCEQSEDILTA
ncbi:hypothetical protein [Listeria monocytogenes]|uniref:hypothetical protein n=1 Tax=Listeria monocytogenes TaxID=1639 RepID=UPI003F961E2C